jgi:hypothetical protein
LIDFNGQLINKVNGNYHKLTEDEIKFYNKLIYSNLKVLNNIANNMISKQTLIEEWFKFYANRERSALKKLIL